jgi:hypothetical protein
MMFACGRGDLAAHGRRKAAAAQQMNVASLGVGSR